MREKGSAFFRPSTQWILPNLEKSFIASPKEQVRAFSVVPRENLNFFHARIKFLASHEGKGFGFFRPSTQWILPNLELSLIASHNVQVRIIGALEVGICVKFPKRGP